MNITFRRQLLESVSSFCTESGLAMATPELLVDLIVRLARYHEEGRKLAPQVYLTDNIDALLRLLPEGDKLPLSSVQSNSIGIEKMLKTCAPLATEDWLIFGHQRGEEMNFGLFRGAGGPTPIEVDEMVLKDQNEAAVIKAHQVAVECVQIRHSKGSNHYVFFNDKKEDSPPPLQYIESLVRSITINVNENEKQSVQSFLTRTFMKAFHNSHGCILAVTDRTKPPVFLSKDAIIIGEPIDFPSLIRGLKNDFQSLYSLEKKSKLLEGMLGSDGITLFDQRGRLLGYRCFVKITAKNENMVGGARRRAYETLKRWLGRGVSATFMQSQDGWTEFEEIRQ